MIGIPTEAEFETVFLEELSGLGWAVVRGHELDPGSPASERGDFREVVLKGRLRRSIQRLNPNLSDESVTAVMNTMSRPESQVVMAENWRAYQLLTQGVPVEVRDVHGDSRSLLARVVDWDSPNSNDLLAVSQLTVVGLTERRPDVVLFVNGLPLVVLELKRGGTAESSLRSAYNQIRTYAHEIPDLFVWNQITVVTDGVQARAGTFAGRWEHYAPWKTVHGTLAPPVMAQYEVLARGLLQPGRLLDLVKNFTVFSGDAGSLSRVVAKYHQFWAVNKAVLATIEAVEGDRRAGVVWHTQGSGKSYEMLWFAGKVMRDPAMDNPTIVVVTDRNDLDDQLFEETFASAFIGAPLPELPVQIATRDELKSALSGRESGGIIFTTIQKFAISTDERHAGIQYPLLSERRNIVVIVDEAHRSNYDFVDGFARHLRDGLPCATFIGFTGTPIEASDRSTRRVFGKDIDTYDLTQAVEDRATVKVYYEPRLARVELPLGALAEVDDAFRDATSGSENYARDRLKTKWARIDAIVGSERRLAELAADLVSHWESRQEILGGKAMIVTMSRRIAAALYLAIADLRPTWATDDDTTGRIKVVITGSAADDETLQPHIRSKQALRGLKRRAKDPTDVLEIVIVRDMWLTGFDSPSMHTLYVDKPMRGANLMQAIARVNRTYKDKPAGLVVDYLGIADDLRSALQEYTVRDRANAELGQDLRQEAIPNLIEKHEVVDAIMFSCPWRELLAGGGPKAFLRALTLTVEYLLTAHLEAEACSTTSPCHKHRFLAEARNFIRLYAVCAGTEAAEALKRDAGFFEAVRAQLVKTEGSDSSADPNSEVDTAIRQIVTEAMTGIAVIDIFEQAGLKKPELALLDDNFIDQFMRSDRKNLQLEMLRRLLNDEIARIARRNTVAGRQFSAMLADSLLRYQNRALDSAQVIAALAELAHQIGAEGERAGNLGLSDDELVFYDAIRTSDSAVLDFGTDKLKAIAKDLVEIVRRDAKTDWAVKEQVRAKLRATIKRLLRRHGYPPDSQEVALSTVLLQAELMARE
jgi:type I restriction enzyme R subunit